MFEGVLDDELWCVAGPSGIGHTELLTQLVLDLREAIH